MRENMEQRSRPVRLGGRLLATTGYVGLTTALLLAHLNPATEYEVSLYAATPPGFWVGVAVAFLSALVVAFSATDRWTRFSGILLGGMATVAVVALPVLRGYYFHGTHDPLSHVGWTRQMVEQSMATSDLVYPAIHAFGAFLVHAAGLSVWRAMQFVPLIIAAAFLTFVPLVVNEVGGGERATAVGAFAAFLLIPIHPVASTLKPHPSSQAILFTPVVLYLLVRYLHRADPDRRAGAFTATGAALSLAVFAHVLYHPQQAWNVYLLLAVICLVHFLASRTGWTRPGVGHRRVYSVTGLAALAYFGWMSQFPFILTLTSGALGRIRESLIGGEGSAQAGSAVVSTTASIEQIGASLPVFYFKLFFVTTVCVVVTGIVVGWAFLDRFRPTSASADTTTLVRYLGVGLVGMFAVFLFYVVGDVGAYYFRQVAFMTMIGTIVSAVGVAHLWRRAAEYRFRRVAHVAVVVGFALMLPLSMMVVFNSPYIHRANQHVTEAKVDAYETSFQVMDDSAEIVSVRERPQRYYEATVSMTDNGRRDGLVNSSTMRNLTEQRYRDWYLIVGQSDYEREVIAYEEIRYTKSTFATLQRQRGVSRVFANGDTNLYHVHVR